MQRNRIHGAQVGVVDQRELLWRAGVILALAALLLTSMARPAGCAGEAAAPWRIKIKEAAITVGPVVKLGEVAEIVGPLDSTKAESLLQAELWIAPSSEGRAMAMRKDKLEDALKFHLRELVQVCIVPDRLVIQRGGAVVEQAELAGVVAKALAPELGQMEGEAKLRDFKLPPFVFLADAANQIVVEKRNKTIEPGRLSLRLVETRPDGDAVRSIAGSVFVDQWVDAPTARRPLNRDEVLTAVDIEMGRKNAAYLKERVWDGRGGPWVVTRPVGQGQVIYSAGLQPLPMIREGDMVSLVFRGKFVRLEVPALALAGGGYGQAIAVRNLQSNKQILATIRDGSTVEVF